jgi:hypothetical protein
MSLRTVLERHHTRAEQRRTERALSRALARATSPSQIQDLRSLSSR